MLTQESKNGIITTYNYDKNGNLTTESDGTQYTYDAFNQLVETDKQDGTWQQNVYDATGLRMATVENGTYTGYTYDRDNILAEYNKDDSRTTRYIRGYDLISQKKDAGETYHYLHNAHGDITKLVDTAGKVQNSYSYDAFGSTTSYSEKVGNKFRYAGEQYDSITGEYYLRARYYDPAMGRFMNEDTYKGQIENPQSMNLYAYCVNNPVIYTDPSGHNGAKCNIGQGTGNGNVSNVPGDYNNNGIPDQYEPKSNSTQGKGKNKSKGTGNLVTAKQLKKFGWRKISGTFVKKLNDTLNKYGITDIESIRLFMATMAAESGWGANTLEQGSKAYFAKKKYKKTERGAGYIQITWRATHLKFLKTMNDSFSGVDTATYIANNYALEAAAWYWSNEPKTSAGNLNAYVEKNGDGSNIFLITQYFVNAFPTQNGNPIPGFDADLASMRKGGSYKIKKDKNGKSVSLSVNGNTYDLPNGWDDRLDAYNKAIKAFK
jgi:RHS repeat-associated protein